MREARAAPSAVGARVERAGLRALGPALAAARGHPRHVVLFALAAGLAFGPVAPAATLAAALLAAAAAGRRAVALLAAGAALAGAVIADARLASLDAGPLRAMTGQRWEGAAVLLEPVREHGAHASARVRLTGLRDTAVARLRVPGARPQGSAGRPGPSRRSWPGVGAVVVLGGRWRRSGLTRPTRPAAGRMPRWRWTGSARPARGGVGWPAGSTGYGGGPSAGLSAGCPARRPRCCAGWCSARTSGCRSRCGRTSSAPGSRTCSRCRVRTSCCSRCSSLAAGMVAGIGGCARAWASALGLVALYVPLAGGGPSIQRAGVMGGAGLVAALAGRPASRWYALGLAAVATLALNPRASGEPGWQLSFAAVAGLLALAPRCARALRRARLPGPLADAAAVTAAATVATAPLMALHFQQVSLASLPANLAAAPAVAPVMWLGMVAIALAPVSPALCGPLNAICGPLLAYLGWIAHVAAQPPAAALPSGSAARPGSPLAYAGGAAVLALAAAAWRRAARSARAAPPPWPASRSPPACSSPSRALDSPGPAAARELVVSFLDIGQGDATLIQHGGASLLVDTGPPGGPILRRLAEAGVAGSTRSAHPRAGRPRGGGARVVRACRPGWCSTAAPARAPRSAPPPRVRVRASRPTRGVARAGRHRAARPVAAPPPPGWRAGGDPNQRASSPSRASAASTCCFPADAESDVTGALELRPSRR